MIEPVPERLQVAEMIANVSGPLQGGLNDWPANIQDQVYAALERLSGRTRKEFTIAASKCDRDEDTGWYVHVVAITKDTLQ